MSILSSRLALLLILGLSATSAQARIVYHWVDAAGAEHFSDTPVAGATQRWVPDSVVNESAAVPSEEDDSSAADDVAALEAGGTLAAMCKSHTAKLKELLEADRIIEEDALGNERVLTAQERDVVLKRTRADVKLACGK